MNDTEDYQRIPTDEELQKYYDIIDNWKAWEYIKKNSPQEWYTPFTFLQTNKVNLNTETLELPKICREDKAIIMFNLDMENFKIEQKNKEIKNEIEKENRIFTVKQPIGEDIKFRDMEMKDRLLLIILVIIGAALCSRIPLLFN